MRTGKIRFERRLVLFLLLLIVVVSVSGVLVYRNLTAVIRNVEQDANRDQRMLALKDLKNELSQSENFSSAYIITGRKDYLAKYLHSVDKIATARVHLDSIFKKEPLLDALTTQIVKRNALLDSLIHLQNDLSRHYVSLVSSKADSLQRSAESEEDRPSLLKRIFSGKNKGSAADTIQVSRIAEDIKSISRREQRRIQRENDLYFSMSDAILAQNDVINGLITELEMQEMQSAAARSKRAEETTGLTNTLVSMYTIFTIVLILLLGFTIYNFIRKEREHRQRLLEAKRRTEELAATKQHFFANMNHELRTPLHAIQGFAEQLLEDDLNRSQFQKAQIIYQSSRNLIYLVNDLLDLAKMEAGKFDLSERVFSPADVLRQSIDLLRPIAKKTRNKLIADIDPELEKAVKGDDIRLQQILLNLGGNALKFTKSGTVTIHVDNREGTLNFEIRDTGVGMSEEQMKRLFDDYEQGSEQGAFRGTGLGLSISKKLIELQDGTITVESEKNRGTLIRFSLPLRPANKEVLKTKSEEQVQQTTDLQELHVLIADDEEYNRKLLRMILQKQNARISEAINGLEVLAILDGSEDEPELVLMDIRMPELDGEQTIIELRKEHPDLPVFAVSASLTEAEKIRFSELGFTGALLKPFSRRELEELIRPFLKDRSIPVEQKSSQSTIEQATEATKQSFNLDSLVQLSHGDAHFLDDMIDTFIRTTREGTEAMELAFADKNWKMLSDQAHKIASPCKHIEAHALYSQLKYLEREAEKEKDKVAPVLDQVLLYTGEIIEALKKLKK